MNDLIKRAERLLWAKLPIGSHAHPDQIDEAARAVVKLVRADLSRPQWQPIETAPRDGTAVLVMRDIWPGIIGGRATECNGHNTYVAMFWPDEGIDGAWICYMDMVREPRCPVDPTHWMPLPAPPEARILSALVPAQGVE